MVKYNRKAVLDVFTFIPTQYAMGRPESTWIMTQDGILRKQNLILGLWDLEYDYAESQSEKTGTFYKIRFNDSLSVRDRIAEIAEWSLGTHSRRTGEGHDDASFGILQKDSLISYLEQLAQARSFPLPASLNL